MGRSYARDGPFCMGDGRVNHASLTRSKTTPFELAWPPAHLRDLCDSPLLRAAPMDTVVSLGPTRVPCEDAFRGARGGELRKDAESKSEGLTRRRFVAVGTLGTAALAAGC